MPRIPRSLVDEMVAHAREDLPNEACGMIHGSATGEPTELYRVTNKAASPYRYDMEGTEIARLELQRARNGEELFAIYHSHVASEARPSMTDIRMAFFPPLTDETRDISQLIYPDAFYILVSLQDAEAPSVRAFHIVAAEPHIIEEPIEVV